MFEALYRLLIRALPLGYDSADRDEMWAVFRARVQQTDEREGHGAGVRHRAWEVYDLAGIVVAGHARGLLGSFRQDLVVGARSLLRTPLIAAFAVLSLGVGIGATSAIFTCLDVWLIRPVPLPNAERLLWVGMADRDRGWGMNAFSLPDFVRWRESAEVVDLAIHRRTGFNLTTGDEAERVAAVVGSSNLLRVLGVDPAMGRAFVSNEEREDGPRTVVLSNGFWNRRFGGDPDALGATVDIDSEPHVVIGILPPLPHIPAFTTDVWLPLRNSGDEPREHVYMGVALRSPGTTVEQAQNELQATAQAAAASDPNRAFPDASVRPFRSYLYGPQYSQGGAILGAAVFFVLLIACANIANLLLARGVGRAHEVSVRAALGAGRWRIIRQFLTESLLLGALGGVAGLVLAGVGLELLTTYLFPSDVVPGLDQMTVNGRVIFGTSILTVAATVVFGLVPALQASRPDLRRPLSAGHRSGESPAQSVWGKALVVAEITLALSLLASTSLIIRSIVDSYSVDMGRRTEGAVVFRVAPPASAYGTSEDVREFHRSLQERLRGIPGVKAVASATGTPVGFGGSVIYSVEEDGTTPEESRRFAHHRMVDAAYSEVMELKLLAGRWFDDAVDVPEGPPVAVVSQGFAELEFGLPGDALGRLVRIGERTVTIVGVAHVGRFLGPQFDEPRAILEPFAQRDFSSRFYVVDSEVPATRTIAGIRGAVREIDPTIAIYLARTLEEEFAEALYPESVTVRLFGALAAIAFLLTVVGVYGVIAHSVGTRTREMGIRMALGADRTGLVRLVVGQSGRLVLVGLVLGVGMSLILGKALTAILPGLHPRDPLALSAVVVLMAVAALTASYLPARRAAAVDPIEALRSD